MHSFSSKFYFVPGARLALSSLALLLRR